MPPCLHGSALQTSLPGVSSENNNNTRWARGVRGQSAGCQYSVMEMSRVLGLVLDRVTEMCTSEVGSRFVKRTEVEWDGQSVNDENGGG